jgi:hypothetical protein
MQADYCCLNKADDISLFFCKMGKEDGVRKDLCLPLRLCGRNAVKDKPISRGDAEAQSKSILNQNRTSSVLVYLEGGTNGEC